MERRTFIQAVLLWLLAIGGLLGSTTVKAQYKPHINPKARQTAVLVQERDGFELRKLHDSLYWLNDWALPYPVYQFQTGDVDGDGRVDAMVGVIKATRFYPKKARRLFIFKQVESRKAPGTLLARPLWMGSKLGGILEDFRYHDGGIRALELTTDSLYVVSDYVWGGFGMSFLRFVEKGTDRATATACLEK
ncbi:MAG: hypothetical protein K5764_05540 [Prevotella sp.]|nr:hypothetical protein [Prevotella sp.]